MPSSSMLLPRFVGGTVGALAAMPLDLLQLRAETDLLPLSSLAREVFFAGMSGVTYTIQTVSRTHIPFPWGALVAALMIAPLSVTLTTFKLRARLPLALSEDRVAWVGYVLLLTLHEFVLYALLGPTGPMIATCVAYVPKWWALRTLLATTMPPPKAWPILLNVVRSTVGLSVSDATVFAFHNKG